MELERGISTTVTAMNLPRLKTMASLQNSHMNWLISFTSE